jgi:hypothetical protein
MAADEDLLARVERLEADSAIRGLVARYALAVDTRNLDDLVALFVPDVDAGAGGTGREALKASFDTTLRRFGRSVHMVGTHVVDLDGPLTAHGVVYCRAEHEWRDRWMVMAMQYLDDYARVDGEWLFRRRRPLCWWARDELERPTGPDWVQWPGRERLGRLPEWWPSWDRFWADTPFFGGS